MTGTWRFDPIPGAPGDAPPYVYEVILDAGRRFDIRASVENYRDPKQRAAMEATMKRSA